MMPAGLRYPIGGNIRGGLASIDPLFFPQSEAPYFTRGAT